MNVYKNAYLFIEDSYTSLGGFRFDWKYSYLMPFPTEMEEFYQDRKDNAVLENIYQPLQDLFLDPIRAASYNIELNTAREDLKFIFNESRLVYNCNEILTSLKLNDITVYATSVEAIDDRIDVENIPIVENIPMKDVKKLVMNGLVVKSALYFEWVNFKDVLIPIEVKYTNNYFIKEARAWISRDGKITLKDMGESLRIKDFDELRYGVLNKFGVELGKIPTSFSLANQQKLLFNMDNQRLSTLRKFDYPLMMLKTNDEIKKMDLSENVIMKIGLDSEFAEYLEANLTGVEITSQLIEEKKAFIYKTFTKDLLTSNVKYTSAVATDIASRSFKSTVNLYYELYQILLETIVEDVKFIYNMNEKNEVINYPDLDDKDNEEYEEQAKNSLGL